MVEDFAETQSLVALNDPQARQRVLAKFFMSHRRRLRLFVDLRLDHRLRAVVDPSDVLQEAFLVATKRLEEYAANPRVPLFLWLRFIAGQKLHEVHELHLGVQKRDARRKVSISPAGIPGASSVAIAD